MTRLLLATRLPEGGDPTARVAADLARRMDGDILLLYVATELETAAQISAGAGLDEESVRERMREECRARLAEFAAAHLAGLGVKPLLGEGKVAEEICRVAAEEAVDLVVIGTEGHTPLQKVVLGSTSHAVLQRSPCPVVVVPPEMRA